MFTIFDENRVSLKKLLYRLTEDVHYRKVGKIMIQRESSGKLANIFFRVDEEPFNTYSVNTLSIVFC